METRDLSTFELRGLEESGRIVGYGSVYGVLDGHGTVFDKGAFGKSLSRRGPDSRPIPMLLEHDLKTPVGIWTRVEEDDNGLLVEGQINMKKAIGQEVYSDLKMRSREGLSAGFQTRKAEPDRTQRGVIRIKEADIFEISIVTFPSNAASNVLQVRSHDLEAAEKWAKFADWAKRAADGDDIRPNEFEALLREAEVSKKLGTLLASRVHRALRSESEVEEATHEPSKEQLEQIRAAVARLKLTFGK